MKLNLLETHDRYQHFTKQSFNIAECCQDLINQRPFGNYPFYIFAHTRTDEDGVTKRLIWQPRLTKPKATTNSMLFKAYPGSDEVKVIWMLPSRELWPQYQRGNVTESATVLYSIDMFESQRGLLEAREGDDVNDETANQIYRELSLDARRKKAMETLYLPI